MKANLSENTSQVLIGSECRLKAMFETLNHSPSERIVALGQEAKRALEIDVEIARVGLQCKPG